MYAKALAGQPWLTRNEVRARENMNAVDGGDEMLLPLNMSTGSPPATTDEGDGDGDDNDDAGEDRNITIPDDVIEALSREWAHRCLGRLQVHGRRAAKEPSRFLQWVDSLENLNADDFRSLWPAALDERGIEADLGQWFDVVRQSMLTASECQPADLTKHVEDAFEQMRGEQWNADFVKREPK